MLVIGFALVSATAFASTVIRMDLKALVSASDAIAIATVTSVKSFERDNKILTTTTFETEQVVAGDLADTFQITQYGGRTERLATYVPGMPLFERNERVLVFLEKTSADYVVTGLSQGVFRLAQSPDGDGDWVLPQIGDLRLVDPEKKSKTVTPSDLHNENRPLKSLLDDIARIRTAK